jgi:DNA-binding transcriptional LysR family regulator
VIGVAVVTRAKGSGAALTPQAEALLPYARRLVGAAEDALAFARGLQPQATFAIGATESVGTYVLPGPLAQVRAAWPSIGFHVRTGLCAELRQLVAAHKLQVALTVGPSLDQAMPPGQTLLPLATTRMSIFHAAAAAAPALEAGREAPAIYVPDPEGSFNALLSGWLQGQGITAPLRSTGSVEAVKRSVIAGTGLGALPLYAIEGELAQGAFVEATVRQALPSMQLEASVLSGTARSEPLATLLDALATITLQRTP